jgi:hypothetical protein
MMQVMCKIHDQLLFAWSDVTQQKCEANGWVTKEADTYHDSAI